MGRTRLKAIQKQISDFRNRDRPTFVLPLFLSVGFVFAVYFFFIPKPLALSSDENPAQLQLILLITVGCVLSSILVLFTLLLYSFNNHNDAKFRNLSNDMNTFIEDNIGIKHIFKTLNRDQLNLKLVAEYYRDGKIRPQNMREFLNIVELYISEQK